MTQLQYRSRTTVTFLIVYCAVYVASVLGAARLFAATPAPGAALIEPYRGRLTVALLVSAVASAFLGNLAASIGVSSYFRRRVFQAASDDATAVSIALPFRAAGRDWAVDHVRLALGAGAQRSSRRDGNARVSGEFSLR